MGLLLLMTLTGMSFWKRLAQDLVLGSSNSEGFETCSATSEGFCSSAISAGTAGFGCGAGSAGLVCS